MKNIATAAFAALLLVNLSCKKTENTVENVSADSTAGNTITTPVLKTDSATAPVVAQDKFDGNKMGDNTYTFKATDGTRAGIIFSNSDKNHTISVKANNTKFQLDRKETTATGAKYERNGVSAVWKGDSVTVMQGDNVIQLVRDK